MWPGVLGAAFIVAFVFYVAIETGTGGWMTSHLESLRIASTTAATLTSAFWLALFVGRLVIALVPADLPERTVVLVAAALSTVCLLATSIPRAAPFAYLAAGVAMAPLYPTGIVWLAKLRPDDARTTAWLFPATGLGGIAGPAAIGLVVGAFGVGWVPAALAIVAAVMTVAFLGANRIAAR
jgi:fucose permease